MARRLAAAAFLIAIVAALAPSPSASASSRKVGMLGTVYRRGVTPHGVTTADVQAARRGRLIYHGGRIMPRTVVHPIFWSDAGHPFPAGYETGVSQYFTDIAADSGRHTNVYSVATQYFDKKRSGRIRNRVAYDVTYSGTPIDVTSPFNNGCPVVATYTACVTDGQVRSVVRTVALTRGLTDIYFVFLPEGVDTCAGRFDCAHNIFCAYHSAVHVRSGWIVYTNQPFGNVSGCQTTHAPNDPNVDDVVSLVSHEHNEAITDPLGTGWYTANGAENGDKCNFTFGALVAPEANQVINGRDYYLQEEWSNHVPRGCQQHR